MDINPVSPASTPPQTTLGGAAKINADFDMFLGLLTAQMRFQDPLDPVDSAQYTQQLVQFSAVEQAVAQTDLLKSILGRLESLELKNNAEAAPQAPETPLE